MKGVLQITQIFKAGASASDDLMSYPGHSYAGFYASAEDAVGVFYSPIREGSRSNYD